MGESSESTEHFVDLVVAELVAEARSGNRLAWDGLVDRFAGLVWSVARSFRLDAADAADVSQTTWLRLVENLDRIKQPERVGAWLATTARREALRTVRTSARQIPTPTEFIVDLTAPSKAVDKAVDIDLLDREQNAQLEVLLEKLPSRCQLILRALMCDGAPSYVEFSTMTNMPIGSIGPTRARCLEHLRRLALSAGVAREDVA